MSCKVSSELVTVAVFATSADAELVRGQLTAANIESQLSTVDRSGPAGQIHVQVAQGDFERAMRLLFPVSERSRAPVAEIGSWTCPKCGQVVFEFSKLCWMCGTSREGVPATSPAPETPALETPASGVGSPAAAANDSLPSTVTPSLPPIPTAPAAAVPDGATAGTPAGAAAATRKLRFARLPPPPPGMIPDADPSNFPASETQVGPSATPRFARVKTLDLPTVESPTTDLAGATGPSAARDPSVVPPARLITPVKPAPQVRVRVDAKQKEIESMTVWAWWTAVVGVLVFPATVYSVWLLLTLTFAAARPSRAGRLRFVGAWCLNVAVIIVWYVVLQARM